MDISKATHLWPNRGYLIIIIIRSHHFFSVTLKLKATFVFASGINGINGRKATMWRRHCKIPIPTQYEMNLESWSLPVALLLCHADETSHGPLSSTCQFAVGIRTKPPKQGRYVLRLPLLSVRLPFLWVNLTCQYSVLQRYFFQFKNLEKPYATNCSKKTLETFSTYSSEGCLYECGAENMVKLCGCRPAGYKGTISGNRMKNWTKI